MAELLVELVTGFVDVIRVDEGLTTTELLLDGLVTTDVGDFTTATELVDVLLLEDELTTPTFVEVEAFTTAEDEDDFTAPALVELTITELVVALVDALAVGVATTELVLDFVDALVVEAGTEEEVVLTTATLIDEDVALTPFGEAGDQNTAGV